MTMLTLPTALHAVSPGPPSSASKVAVGGSFMTDFIRTVQPASDGLHGPNLPQRPRSVRLWLANKEPL